MVYLFDNYVRGGQLKIGWRFNGSSDWQYAFRLPSCGVGYLFSDFGSQKYFGYAHSIYGFVDISIINRKKILWTYNLGIGIGYITKPYDAVKNLENTVIGTNLNAFLLISTGFEYKILKITSLSQPILQTLFRLFSYRINTKTMGQHYEKTVF
jgi:hypothetical protein